MKCSRCSKPATQKVGLNDPDATKYPMCDKHAEEWMIQYYKILGGGEGKLRLWERKNDHHQTRRE